eukprot:1738832-Ditylum_brightwellii.AAC.1
MYNNTIAAQVPIGMQQAVIGRCLLPLIPERGEIIFLTVRRLLHGGVPYDVSSVRLSISVLQSCASIGSKGDVITTGGSSDGNENSKNGGLQLCSLLGMRRLLTLVLGHHHCQTLVTHIVLGRELSVFEIKSVISDVAEESLEVEAFVHGVLCISYSGQCFSSEAWEAIVLIRDNAHKLNEDEDDLSSGFFRVPNIRDLFLGDHLAIRRFILGMLQREPH